ncbi:MAG: hypothetical protein IK077_16715, partial [Thermoguttaceae bacterium]|nr:hypothetical protein [Thermoguttaceae bacterium]
TAEEKLELIRSTDGFEELERRIRKFFSTEEGKRVFIAQREFDSWMRDLELEREEDRQARFKAEREREEAERRALESQKKGVLRLFKNKFGANAELPENWVEGRTYDELETLADKIYECVDLQEALDLFR